MLIGDPIRAVVVGPLQLISIMFLLASLKMSRGAGNILPGNTSNTISSSFPSPSHLIPPLPSISAPWLSHPPTSLQSAYQKRIRERRETSDSLQSSAPLIHHT